MNTIAERARQADELWLSAIEAESLGNYSQAYQLHTEAHDLIMDCARLHQVAHVHLRRVNLRIGNYGELATDWLLHIFAPLGIFELVSYFSKTGTFGTLFCRRSA